MEILTQDYKTTFSTASGKKVLDDLMKSCNMISSTVGKKIDVNEMLLEEGKRAVCLRILAFLETDINQLRERIRIDNTRRQYDEY